MPNFKYVTSTGTPKVTAKADAPKRAYIFLEGDDRLNFMALSALAGEGQNKFGLAFIREMLEAQISEAKRQMKDRFQPEWSRIVNEIKKADAEEAAAKAKAAKQSK